MEEEELAIPQQRKKIVDSLVQTQGVEWKEIFKGGLSWNHDKLCGTIGMPSLNGAHFLFPIAPLCLPVSAAETPESLRCNLCLRF